MVRSSSVTSYSVTKSGLPALKFVALYDAMNGSVPVASASLAYVILVLKSSPLNSGG